ncbi:MAG: aldolase/citrate lyase family protein [Clostridia bacterium]|nr:aldolase/citrate lyase family protein [Clostridia bacterium]
MRLRRTMLFVPGNNPGMLQSAHIYQSDALMFDLEDSVPQREKDAARLLVYHALRAIDYGACERVVRVNPLSTPHGRQDIEAMVRAGAEVIRLPKTDTAADIHDAETEIERVERAAGLPIGRTKLLAAIESALGVVNAYAIASASPRVTGIALGAEDYCASLRTTRSEEGSELFYARAAIVVAARAAGVDALDTVYSDVNNEAQLIMETRRIRQLGFDGKSIINPRQIKPVHAVFTPTEQEIQKALSVRAAMREAEARGSGVLSLDGSMIDRPVLLRAERCLALARAAGIRIGGEEA